MFVFGKRFYAPIYVIALIATGMILIYISESFGISHRTDNIDLRNANSIILADKTLKKQVNILNSQNQAYSYSNTNNNLERIDYLNSISSKCSGNICSSYSNTQEIEVNKISRINMILINSVSQ
jgi:hypothetical protein